MAGSGSDFSEELAVGVEPAALDCRVAPWRPPGPAARLPWSWIMSRHRWSASRRFSPLSQVDVVEGDSSSASHDVPVLGAVKIVPRVGGCILTAPALRRVGSGGGTGWYEDDRVRCRSGL